MRIQPPARRVSPTLLGGRDVLEYLGDSRTALFGALDLIVEVGVQALVGESATLRAQVVESTPEALMFALEELAGLRLVGLVEDDVFREVLAGLRMGRFGRRHEALGVPEGPLVHESAAVGA